MLEKLHLPEKDIQIIHHPCRETNIVNSEYTKIERTEDFSMELFNL